MLDHRPLRFTRADTEGRCPGNSRPFSVQSGLALGHEISTDVVEIQGSIRIRYAHCRTGRIPAAEARTARGVGCRGSTAR
jgi:hypothetical protein